MYIDVDCRGVHKSKTIGKTHIVLSRGLGKSSEV